LEKDKIPEDFLLNPELIDKFLGMFKSKIGFLEEELEKTENIVKQIKVNIDLLQEKHDIMLNYSKFISGKGFGYMKQAIDNHFKNMKEAESNRIVENKYCGMSYIFMKKRYNCLKPKGHDEKCGVI